MASRIDYLDETWNPIEGCTAISEGCKNCWAAGMMKRFRGGMHRPQFRMDRLPQLMKWRKPRRVGVCFTSDLWHEDVTDSQRSAVFGMMENTPEHTYVLLTKRAEQMADWSARYLEANECFPRNQWMGVTCETQKRYDERVPWLLRTRAAVRWLSLEPLLGPIHFEEQHLLGLHWIVVGCESGAAKRPLEMEWVKSIARQLSGTGIALYVKQLPLNGKVNHNPAEFPPLLRCRKFPEYHHLQPKE